jgi:hypothetical protein
VGASAWLGAPQIATLTALGEPSSLRLWLADPASHGGAVAGFSSCQVIREGPYSSGAAVGSFSSAC